jgi:hypothetical protein
MKIKDDDACPECGDVDCNSTCGKCEDPECLDCILLDDADDGWTEHDGLEDDGGPTFFEDVFGDIFSEAFNLLVERQRKYGPENIRQLGLFGVFDRLSSDKIERVRRAFNGSIVNGRVQLEDQTDFVDESFDDALLDIANYALIMLALKRDQWGYPMMPE